MTFKPLVRKPTHLSYFFVIYLVFIAFQFTNKETLFHTRFCVILKSQFVAYGSLMSSSELPPWSNTSLTSQAHMGHLRQCPLQAVYLKTFLFNNLWLGFRNSWGLREHRDVCGGIWGQSQQRRVLEICRRWSQKYKKYFKINHWILSVKC